jgi:hypothetical protein
VLTTTPSFSSISRGPAPTAISSSSPNLGPNLSNQPSQISYQAGQAVLQRCCPASRNAIAPAALVHRRENFEDALCKHNRDLILCKTRETGAEWRAKSIFPFGSQLEIGDPLDLPLMVHFVPKTSEPKPISQQKEKSHPIFDEIGSSPMAQPPREQFLSLSSSSVHIIQSTREEKSQENINVVVTGSKGLFARWCRWSLRRDLSGTTKTWTRALQHTRKVDDCGGVGIIKLPEHLRLQFISTHARPEQDLKQLSKSSDLD